MDIISQKQRIRTYLRRKRKALESKEISSQKIVYHLTSFLQNQKAQKIGLYYPTGSEVSLLSFAQSSQLDYQLALPKISLSNIMYFTPWQWGEALCKEAFSIPAPKGEKIVIPHIICVPLLGFTAQKYRLGQGGGYYDKYIHSHKKHNILWLGVAFECQKLLDMPLEKHDEKLDFIITEKQIY